MVPPRLSRDRTWQWVVTSFIGDPHLYKYSFTLCGSLRFVTNPVFQNRPPLQDIMFPSSLFVCFKPNDTEVNTPMPNHFEFQWTQFKRFIRFYKGIYENPRLFPYLDSDTPGLSNLCHVIFSTSSRTNEEIHGVVCSVDYRVSVLKE